MAKNTGARGLRAILENILTEAMFEVCGHLLQAFQCVKEFTWIPLYAAQLFRDGVGYIQANYHVGTHFLKLQQGLTDPFLPVLVKLETPADVTPCFTLTVVSPFSVM